MDPSRVHPAGLIADARTEAHARRCQALRQLVELGHLSRGGDDAHSDDDEDDQALLNRASRDLAALIDLDALERGARRLQRTSGFPRTTLHTFAVKANPCEGVLRAFRALGFGAEVASWGELEAALAAGFPPSKVVFDSPCKTRQELRRALTAGVRVNLDSLAEIARVAALLEGTAWGREVARAIEQGDATAAPVIGARVNPQVGAGSIAALSTSTDDSKFGVPIGGEEEDGAGSNSGGSERAALADAFREHAWLRALHLHVGSQGVPLEAVAEGAARAWAFARGALPPGRLVAFDIGGGTPVDFSSDDPSALGEDSPPFAELARLLRARVPELWDGEDGDEDEEAAGGGRRRPRDGRPPPPPPLLITENGRALVAKAGCVAARVEYVKHDYEDDDEQQRARGAEQQTTTTTTNSSRRRRRRPIAVCHAGADLLMRACYLPAQWSLRLLVVDGESFGPRETQAAAPQERQGAWRPRDVAGPLCFQGDRLGVSRLLPPIEQGDWVVLPDAGAYALAMWSHYNSRQSPALWGYRGGGEGEGGGATLELELLRRGETLGDVLAFWSLGGSDGGGGGGRG